MMLNAKEEFISIIPEGRWIKCAVVYVMNDANEEELAITLKIGYSQKDYYEFLEKLNFSYDNGYGMQYIHGNIWYTDGTWSGREEYDGSEWWGFMEAPCIPKELL